MRLCWNDSFGGPLGNMKAADAQFVRNIDYEVAAGVVADVRAWPVHTSGVGAFPSGPDGIPIVLRTWVILMGFGLTTHRGHRVSIWSKAGISGGTM